MTQPEENRATLIEFPTQFPIKIMGLTRDDFAQTILEIVTRHAPDFDGATMEMRSSSNAKYLSLTCTINAMSQSQLDDLYRELSKHEMVKIVL
jgi:uncharacterized protein